MNKDTNRPIRLWPGILIAVLQLLALFVVPLVAPDATMYSIMGAVLGGPLVAIWWVFFSRAPWAERLGALALTVIAVLVTPLILHDSIRGGMMGMMFGIRVIPFLSIVFVAGVSIGAGLSVGRRRVVVAAAIVFGCGVFALVRTDGLTGGGDSQFAWRWSATPEERLLSEADDGRGAPVAVPVATDIEAAWPGFRGPNRDSIIRGLRIETDWTAAPPVELWRRSVGPGWSSFSVLGGLFYTQEQRGEEEIVTAYLMSSGEPVWRHRDDARFWESNGGAGPRGTPTLRDGRVYTFGATGILNALDASDGTLVWSRNAAADTGAKLPGWGFASSPLIVDDLVVIATAGQLVAYDRETSEPRWFGPPKRGGYSSPHLMTIGGVTQIVLMGGDGVTSVAPSDGTLLWEHSWPQGVRIVQPALTADGDLLISAGEGIGLRRLSLDQSPSGWSVTERWTTNRLKPYFNDFVVHDGHAYGFDGRILACIDVATGERKWKGGRYGHGQLVLLPDQNVLLVLSEEGELVLVRAAPDQFAELARVPALDGKTWNHPVLVGDRLLVRNGEEMVAFRLSLAES